MPDRYKRISKRGSHLLNCDEGYEVDFKSTQKFDAEDLVAFANSSGGGALLLGVSERTSKSGKVTGKPEGLRLTDQLRLAILGKANSCFPPVDVMIVEENSSKTPFVRVEVPSGEHKPYCTSSGVYKMRDDGSNKAITPPVLLSMFLEREAGTFLTRFANATEDLRQSLSDLRESVEDEVQRIGESLSVVHHNVVGGLEDIGDAASEAHSNSEEANVMAESANSYAHDALEESQQIRRDLAELSIKVDSILIENEIRDRSVDPERNPLVFLMVSGEDSLSQSIDQLRTEFFKKFPTAREEDFNKAISLRDKFQRKRVNGDSKET